MAFNCRRFLPCIAGLCGMLFLVGCSDDKGVNNTGTGRLTLDIEIDPTFTYPDGTAVDASRFTVPEVQDVSLSMRSMVGDYSHVWTSFADFPQSDIYFVGTYYLDAFYGYATEGFGHPYYSASATVNIISQETLDEHLTLRPVSTANNINFTPEFSSAFTSVRGWLHAQGGGYYDCAPAETELLYLLPGHTSLYLDLTLPDGTRVGYKAADLPDAVSGVLYDYNVSLDTQGEVPVIICQVGQTVTTQALDAEFLSAAPPTLIAEGWNPATPYVLPEGEIPSEPLKAVVSSSSPLARLNLTVKSACLNSKGIPEQCDLLALTPEQQSLLSSAGLRWSHHDGITEVDFTELLGSLVFLNDAQAMTSFGLMAADEQGRIGNPLMLDVRTTSMDITVASVPAVMVGAEYAEINVRTDAKDFSANVGVQLLDDKGKWSATEVLSADRVSDGLYALRFAIPEGSADITARILYCDEERADVVIDRFMPQFNVEIDAFATYGCVRVTAEDAALVPSIVKGLDIYLNGSHVAVLARYADQGIIVVTGLTPSTAYTLTSTMMSNPGADDFTPGLKFTTESSPGLPNDEFQHRKDGVYYEDLPSGGRYSQTTVAIFNWQNRETIIRQVPREWANTNAKTFSRRSANHNTWYMQPSVFSVRNEADDHSYSVCLRSVAFDLNGPIIPDYMQTGQPYLKYSPIVPEIACRAAGKLFLGSYAFDPATMKETYNDIVDWRSRPMALNGYYKYSPSAADPSDYGLAIIEVYGNIDGERRVIGSSVARLPVANSSTAFQATLSYDYFGVKATGIKVMFASSKTIGTIEEETAAILTAPDPVSGASLGSTLWLDHVNLSY